MPATRHSRLIPLAAAMALPAVAQARNLTSADGPGGTYELIRQNYTTELPDCGHMVPHITEEFDDELKKNVFIFHAHVNLDDDRCGGKDRQRTEIRAHASDIVAQNGETVWYRWKFRLDKAFQGSTRFTHIFQIKSDLGAPIMTLTPRVSTFEITGRASGNSPKVDLARFRGVWVVVDLKVLFSDAGRVEITIRRIPDGEVLFSYAGGADMWDANASGHDSKFGIYRSLDAKELLRDEQVRFADFCASKVNAKECDDGVVPMGGGSSPDAGAVADASARDTGNAATGGAGSGGVAGGGTGGAGGGTGGAAGGGTGGAGGRTTAAPDASVTPPRPTTGPTEEPPPTDTPDTHPRAGSSGGCNLGGGAPGMAAALALLAMARLSRRRR